MQTRVFDRLVQTGLRGAVPQSAVDTASAVSTDVNFNCDLRNAYQMRNTFHLVVPRFPRATLSPSSMACKNQHPFLSSLESVEKLEMYLGYFIPKLNSYLREGVFIFLNSCLHSVWYSSMSRSGEYDRNPPGRREWFSDPHS